MLHFLQIIFQKVYMITLLIRLMIILHLLHRYIKLRKKVLGLDELHMYDLYTPLVKDVKMEIKYEEAKELVIKGSCSIR